MIKRQLAIVVLACSMAWVEASSRRRNDEVHATRDQDRISRPAQDVCQGCAPGLCFPSSGCAGCDELAGWCADGDGCTKDCEGDTSKFDELVRWVRALVCNMSQSKLSDDYRTSIIKMGHGPS